MRKLIFQAMISVDGFYEGPGKALDWHEVDEEFGRYAAEMLNHADTLLFGRLTYEMMAAYWQSERAAIDPAVAHKMNNLEKLVFSKTLKDLSWRNARLAGPDLETEIKIIKQSPGRNILLLGSAGLALSFLEQGLIDEMRIITVPVVLGAGRPLFKGINHRMKLRLIDIKPLSSGKIIQYYRP